MFRFSKYSSFKKKSIVEIMKEAIIQPYPEILETD